jgi:hypothetical protein
MIGRFIGFTKCGSLVIRRRYKYYANDKLEREDPKFVLIDPKTLHEKKDTGIDPCQTPCLLMRMSFTFY